MTLALQVTAAASAQDAEVVDAGSVVVVDGIDRTVELSGGGSGIVFSLRTPEGATCPGDSATDQWRVSSFVIPGDDDPAELSIGPISPDAEGQWALYAVNTRPYINAALQQKIDGASGPARILEHPDLSFAVFPPGTLPGGEYTIGIACSLLGDVFKFWDTRIVITDDPEDEPGQMTWRVAAGEVGADAPVGVTENSGRGLGFWLIVAGAAVGAVAFIGSLRRPSTPTSTEPSAGEQTA